MNKLNLEQKKFKNEVNNLNINLNDEKKEQSIKY